MKKLLILSVLCLLSLAGGQWNQRTPRYFIEAHHQGPFNMTISCLNGGDPTGMRWHGMLLISCGDVRTEANPDKEK